MGGGEEEGGRGETGSGDPCPGSRAGTVGTCWEGQHGETQAGNPGSGMGRGATRGSLPRGSGLMGEGGGISTDRLGVLGRVGGGGVRGGGAEAEAAGSARPTSSPPHSH